MALIRIIKALVGILIIPLNIRRFEPLLIFKGKRIAIVGPANSAFDEERGSYIDAFDLVIRLNKAPHSFKEENVKFIGRKTDILYHSFFENSYSGGGPLDFKLYEQQNIKWVINPRNTWDGWRGTFNFYKKYLKNNKIYFLPRKYQKLMDKLYGKWRPTMGGYALFCLLSSSFEECYITGFTFFKTPYGKGYRDELTDPIKNDQHIKEQGIHNPDLEFQVFLRLLKKVDCSKVIMDKQLRAIVDSAKHENPIL